MAFCSNKSHRVTEHQHHLSPTNRWAVRENQPTCGNCPQNLLQLPTKQLGGLHTNGTVHAQCKTLGNNKEGTIWAVDGIHPTRPSTRMPQWSAQSGVVWRALQRSMKTSSRGNETCTRIVDQGNKVQTLPEGRLGVAWCQKYHHHSSNNEIAPSPLWATLSNRSDQSGGV